MKNEIREMVLYRIERANDAIEEVKALVNVKKYSAAISRIYYGMFYIASALCLCDGFSTSKHGKLIGYFNKNYVKTRIIDRDLGRVFTKAFNLRIDGDYKDFVTFTREQVDDYYDKMKEFINEVEKIIQQKIGDTDSDN